MLLLSNPAPRVRLITISRYEVGHEAAPPTPLRRQMQIPSGACPNKMGQAAMTCPSARGGRGQPPVSLKSHPKAICCWPSAPDRPRPSSPAQAHNPRQARQDRWRSEEHTSELQSLMRISYAVFFLK